jgi:hypothetical protein
VGQRSVQVQAALFDWHLQQTVCISLIDVAVCIPHDRHDFDTLSLRLVPSRVFDSLRVCYSFRANRFHAHEFDDHES